MNMEHRERKRWCEEISKINRKLNDTMKGRKMQGENKIFSKTITILKNSKLAGGLRKCQ